MTATRTSTASAERVAARPRVGVLGIMQELYDDMLPGITERQARVRARRSARALGDGRRRPRRRARAQPRRTSRPAMRGFEQDGLDGVLVVMLTYGPGMRVARALARDAAADLPRQHPAGRRGHRPPGTWAT